MRQLSVLFVYVNYSSFVKADYEMLSSFANVTKYQFKPGKGIFKTGLSLLKELIFLIFNGYKYDSVLIWFGDYHSLLPVLFAKMIGKKSFVVIGGYDVSTLSEYGYGAFANPIRAFFTRNTFKYMGLGIPVAEALKIKLLQINPKAKAETIATISYPDKFAFADYERPKRVITISSTESEQRLMVKGLDRFRELALCLPEYEFVVIGVSEKVKHYFEPIPANLVLSPPKQFDELTHIYQGASFYAQLSRSEGLPNALCEAMLCGCIPVGTNVGDIKLTIGNTGCTIDEWNTDILVEFIRQNHNKNDLRNSARNRIIELYNPENRIHKFRKYFTQGKRRMLMLTDGNIDHASARIRALQYIPYFQENGYCVHHIPRVPIRPSRSFGKFFVFPVLKRWYAFKMALNILFKHWDVVFIQRISITPFLIKYLNNRLVQIVYDFDDAIYINPKRPTDEKKTKLMVGNASHVVISTDFLAPFCIGCGKKPVIIPSPVETDRLKPIEKTKAGIPTIGWIGSPWTSVFLNLVEKPLQKLSANYQFQFLTVGAADDYRIADVDHVARPWVFKNENDDLGQMDIGIMPLPDTEFARMKGGYKLLQYFSAGIPCVASHVGINQTIIKPGENGFLATGNDDWYEILKKLILDPRLRSALGKNGRCEAIEFYSREVCFQKLLLLMNQTCWD